MGHDGVGRLVAGFAIREQYFGIAQGGRAAQVVVHQKSKKVVIGAKDFRGQKIFRYGYS